MLACVHLHHSGLESFLYSERGVGSCIHHVRHRLPTERAHDAAKCRHRGASQCDTRRAFRPSLHGERLLIAHGARTLRALCPRLFAPFRPPPRSFNFTADLQLRRVWSATGTPADGAKQTGHRYSASVSAPSFALSTLAHRQSAPPQLQTRTRSEAMGRRLHESPPYCKYCTGTVVTWSHRADAAGVTARAT